MNRTLGRWMIVFVLAGVAGGARAQFDEERATITGAANHAAVEPGQDAVVAIVYDVKKGFHAQSHTPKDPNLIALTITPDATSPVKFGEVIYPPGVDETYPALGEINVYSGKNTFYVPFTVPADAKAGSTIAVKGKIRYQICDDNTCFSPETKPWSVELKLAEKGQAVAANAELFKAYKPGAGRSTTKPATQASAAGQSGGAPPVVVAQNQPKWGVAWALLVAFAAGVMFNIVPCVLPVLPIKVLGFAEIAEHDRGKTVALAGVFSLGIVSVFAVLALFILVLKKITWGEQFANPYFAWGVVILLLVLSMWLFGLLNVNLPARAYAFTPRHDTYVGNFQWGVLTAVLSTPCTGPLFPPVMLWAQSQPVATGVSIMLTIGVGMAFPYLVLSAFPEAARKFPRVGPWSELFKQMLGFVLLGFTFFFAAGRLTTAAGQWWAMVPVAVMAAFYLMARTVQLSKDARPVAIATVLSVLILSASVLVACRFSGVFDPRPDGGGSAVAVNWQPYSDATIDAARKANKIVLVKFTANWCLNCQTVEANVFHDAQAINALRKHDVVTVKADLTMDDAPGWARLRQLSATGGIPLTAIYAPGYDQPVVISGLYTTGTLVSAVDQLAGATRAASAQAVR